MFLSLFLTLPKKSLLPLIASLFIFEVLAQDEPSTPLSAYEFCLATVATEMQPEQTLAELKEYCNQTEEFTFKPSDEIVKQSLARDRIQIQTDYQFQPFVILAHKPNFVMPLTLSSSAYNSDLVQQQYVDDSIEYDPYEFQFQLSFKIPLVAGVFSPNDGLYFGYTNRSFWQIYNSKQSHPFRETNHEPELWLQAPSGYSLLGINNLANMLGIVHESNGQGDTLSRSWNRLYLSSLFESGPFLASIKLWHRLPETDSDDDNPKIMDYMGHGSLRLIYVNGKHTISMMSRNNLESGFERGAVELSWSFPIHNRDDVRYYLQAFSGYGESLIDFDRYVSRIGVGVVLADWL